MRVENNKTLCRLQQEGRNLTRELTAHPLLGESPGQKEKAERTLFTAFNCLKTESVAFTKDQGQLLRGGKWSERVTKDRVMANRLSGGKKKWWMDK